MSNMNSQKPSKETPGSPFAHPTPAEDAGRHAHPNGSAAPPASSSSFFNSLAQSASSLAGDTFAPGGLDASATLAATLQSNEKTRNAASSSTAGMCSVNGSNDGSAGSSMPGNGQRAYGNGGPAESFRTQTRPMSQSDDIHEFERLRLNDLYPQEFYGSPPPNYLSQGIHATQPQHDNLEDIWTRTQKGKGKACDPQTTESFGMSDGGNTLDYRTNGSGHILPKITNDRTPASLQGVWPPTQFQTDGADVVSLLRDPFSAADHDMFNGEQNMLSLEASADALFDNANTTTSRDQTLAKREQQKLAPFRKRVQEQDTIERNNPNLSLAVRIDFRRDRDMLRLEEERVQRLPSAANNTTTQPAYFQSSATTTSREEKQHLAQFRKFVQEQDTKERNNPNLSSAERHGFQRDRERLRFEEEALLQLEGEQLLIIASNTTTNSSRILPSDTTLAAIFGPDTTEPNIAGSKQLQFQQNWLETWTDLLDNYPDYIWNPKDGAAITAAREWLRNMNLNDAENASGTEMMQDPDAEGRQSQAIRRLKMILRHIEPPAALSAPVSNERESEQNFTSTILSESDKQEESDAGFGGREEVISRTPTPESWDG